MGKLRTSEELDEYFNQLKEKREIKKLKEKQQRQKEAKERRQQDEKIKEKNRLYQQKWVERNKEKAKEQNRLKQERWRERHPRKNLEKVLQFKNENPIKYRAKCLISAYNYNDKLRKRGKGDLTVKWVVDNILFKPCHYCGETGWEIMGCDRIDNDLPHTKDNVVPCCGKCNIKRGRKSYEEFLQIMLEQKL